MKKSLLIASLLAIALAACGKKEEAPAAPAASAPAETAPAAAAPAPAASAPADAAAANCHRHHWMHGGRAPDRRRRSLLNRLGRTSFLYTGLVRPKLAAAAAAPGSTTRRSNRHANLACERNSRGKTSTRGLRRVGA